MDSDKNKSEGDVMEVGASDRTNDKDNVDAKGEIEGGMEAISDVDLKTVLDKGSADQFVYNMNHPKRGKALIFNNKTFTTLPERKGTDVDASAMDLRLKSLGFEVFTYHNKTVAEMLQIIRDAACMDHSQNDAFAMVILSHGDEQGVYGTDRVVSVETIISPFKEDKCPSLIGKPKLFFIQACRGNDFDSGVVVEADADVEQKQTLLTDADNMLIAYSVVPGNYSWRNRAEGSWFMQSLCRVFEEYGEKKDIQWMMTRVNGLVAFDFESNTRSKTTDGKKQMPAITSMLTKELYFRPK